MFEMANKLQYNSTALETLLRRIGSFRFSFNVPSHNSGL